MEPASEKSVSTWPDSNPRLGLRLGVCEERRKSCASCCPGCPLLPAGSTSHFGSVYGRSDFVELHRHRAQANYACQNFFQIFCIDDAG